MENPRYVDKRVVVVSILIALIAMAFWAGSRVPALNEKAAMGGNLFLEDPLSFEALFPIDPSDPVFKKIGFTTINWLDTNKQGMTFGLALAAAFMTLLSLLKTRNFEGHFSNTLLGIVIGAPLGVCVNCAAPLARGLHSSGARLETTLAAMVSSPTLNVIVLTMLFTLLPPYMGLIKLGLTLLFLLIAIPLLSRLVFKDELVSPDVLRQAPSHSPFFSAISQDDRDPIPNGWTPAVGWTISHYLHNLWHIVKFTFPLMVLAGFLGAVVVTLFPWQHIAGWFPDTGAALSLLGMGTVALFGLLLPVPMAFDVVVVAALVAAGFPMKFSMVLLFTLGIFSIYPFFILWRGISKRVATVLTATLLLLGVISGVAAHYYHQWDEPRQQALFLEQFSQTDWKAPPKPTLPQGTTGEEILEKLAPVSLKWKLAPSLSTSAVTVQQMDFATPKEKVEPLFTRHYGKTFGLDRVENTPVALKFMSLFYRYWPIASGDVHGDGWVDVILGTDLGLFLYANRGGEGFELQRIDVSELRDLPGTNVALIDLNNDGWLDIFLSSYRAGNHVIYNDHGRFTQHHYRRLPDTGSNVANAAAFGDLDRDGDLDIVLGNLMTGRWTRLPPEPSRNALLWNDNPGYRVERLPGMPGETLSTLFSDINQDGYLDLLVGNDFDGPDVYYLGQPQGGLEAITRRHGVFPHTTYYTMSIDSADVDNDLVMEIYVGGVSGRRASEENDLLRFQPVESSCQEFDDPTWRKRCEAHVGQHRIIHDGIQTQNPFLCLKIDDPQARGDCMALQLLEKGASFGKHPELCNLFPPRWKNLQDICHLGVRPPPTYDKKMMGETLPQVGGQNVFFVRDGQERYRDRAEAMQVAVAGWTWNAKFADLDNDEWQDLYVVNGHYRSNRRETNLWLRNAKGRTFIDATEDSGLLNHLSMGTYTYIDFDNDGDLDIITVSFDGPVWVYQNNTQQRRALSFEFDDKRGNRFGIGNRVVIHYGERGERHQLREIKAGGGYLSVDSPRAHFGLGEYDRVVRIDIFWSTGERTTLHGPFETGKRYRLERKNLSQATNSKSN